MNIRIGTTNFELRA